MSEVLRLLRDKLAEYGHGDRPPSPPAWMLAVEGELALLLASLPKTADGVPIVPGMTVFILRGTIIDERVVAGPYGSKSVLCVEPPVNGSSMGNTHWSAGACYSTRDAAEAAKPKPPTLDDIEVFPHDDRRTWFVASKDRSWWLTERGWRHFLPKDPCNAKQFATHDDALFAAKGGMADV